MDFYNVNLQDPFQTEDTHMGMFAGMAHYLYPIVVIEIWSHPQLEEDLGVLKSCVSLTRVKVLDISKCLK